MLFAGGYEAMGLADVEVVNGVADTNVAERPNDDALAASFGKFTRPAPPPATSRVARTVGSNVGWVSLGLKLRSRRSSANSRIFLKLLSAIVTIA